MSLGKDETVDYGDIVDPVGLPIGPIHPGEILKEDFLDPLGITPGALARAISVPRNRVTALIHGERSVTADTALRLARFFGMSAEFWLRLQMTHDLEVARADLIDRIDTEVSPLKQNPDIDLSTDPAKVRR